MLSPPPGSDLVFTTDAMVEGVHWLPGEDPARLARKLLRVNLSDLAAMAADPLGYLLTLALPSDRGEAWLAAFAEGLAADQEAFGIVLWGGDSVSTPGPPVLSLTAIGTVPSGAAIARSGARVGDRIWVSGTLGDGRLGLVVLQGGLAGLDSAGRDALAARYHLPEPRIAVGRGLRGLATSMLDLSDGLPGDAARIAEASRVLLAIEADRVPLSDPARRAVSSEDGILRLALSGGDDYELLFTAPPSADAVLDALARRTGVPLTAIGSVEAGQGVRILDAAGRPLEGLAGWVHY